MSDQHIFAQDGDKSSLRGKLYHRLRADILSGKYSENKELRENTIAKEYGVSRTPVREAIRQLELEGLVATIPNKGAYVRGIDKKDIDDIYAIRALLEGLCARWATENITERQLEELDEIMYMTKYHLDKGHFDQVYEYDGKFHDALYAASNSGILNHTLQNYHEYVQRARKHSLRSERRAMKSYQEHVDLVNAIKEKSADEAARLAELHIQNTVKNFKETDLDKAIQQ